MSRLHDLLEEASRQAPDQILTPDLPRTAWTDGRGRRRTARRRAAVMTAVAVIAVIAVASGARAVWVTTDPAALSDTSTGQTGNGPATYPQRISRVLSTDPIPDRPGRLAGVATQVDPEQEATTYLGVTAQGLRWTIDSDEPPALSPDGRVLVTTDTAAETISVHDLVNGTRRVVAGTRTAQDSQPTLGAWSPNGRSLLVQTRRTQNRRAYQLVDVATATAKPGATVLGAPIGLADDGTVTALRTATPGTRTTGPTGTITTTTQTGQVRSVTLQPRPALVSSQITLDSDYAATSPDGRRVVIVDVGTDFSDGNWLDDGGWQDAHITVFSTRTGRQLTRTRIDDLAWGGVNTVMAWTRGHPVVPARAGPQAVTSIRVNPTGTHRIVAVYPRLHVSDITWAGEALDGRAAPGRFGTHQAWWSWHPRYVQGAGLALGAVGLIALIVLTVAVRRRTRHPQTSRPPRRS